MLITRGGYEIDEPLPDPQRRMAITTPAAERYRAASSKNAVTAETN
jgi:hypothetical protein